MDSCLICVRIDLIKNNTNPWFVKELETGYVVLGDHQFFRGYALFLCKEHVFELHELETNFKKQFLEEMSIVAEAVYCAFKPKKLNYELLGNGDPHLHWHIFPRHSDDLLPNKPIWQIDKDLRSAENQKPSPEELEKLKKIFSIELEKILVSRI